MSDQEREPPRRLRAADVIDAQAETIRRLTERHTASAPQVAVDFGRNAKGETQPSIKLTVNMEADLAAVTAFVERVYEIAEANYERACRRFPTSTGTVTNDAPPQKAK